MKITVTEEMKKEFRRYEQHDERWRVLYADPKTRHGAAIEAAAKDGSRAAHRLARLVSAAVEKEENPCAE